MVLGISIQIYKETKHLPLYFSVDHCDINVSSKFFRDFHGAQHLTTQFKQFTVDEY